MEQFCAKHDPLSEEYVDLPAYISKNVSLFDAQNAIKNAERELWDHITNDHGGPWDKLKPFFVCYSPRKHADIKETLEFWIRNINRLENGLPPITNPLWLRSRNSTATIRLERKLVSFSCSQYGVRLVLLLSSNVEPFLQEIESSILFPTMEEERVMMFSSVTIKKGKNVQIISADEELEKESQKWFRKEMSLYPLYGESKS